MDTTRDARFLAARVLLALLALEAAFIGIPALLFPRAFFDHFLWGFSWLPSLGPYSEHFTRDAGALYLGFAAMLGLATWRPTPSLVRGAALGFLVATAPHMIYHALHEAQSGVGDTITQSGLLAVTVGGCIVVLLWCNAFAPQRESVSGSEPETAEETPLVRLP